MNDPLARTPLHDWHASHGARMVDFAGWSMPVQYTSIVAEHEATRTAVGLFDISHMGRLRFDGPGAASALEGLVTRRVANLGKGRIRYALMTGDDGGTLDDVLVYRLADAAGGEYWLMVVNASNRAKICRWIEPRLAQRSDVQWADLTEQWAMIAVQGPRALELVQPLVEVDLAGMKYYSGVETSVAGHGGIVSRTGYTGEDGYELIVGAEAALSLWETLHERGQSLGAVAAGLGCRDTLRLEAGMPLYGHELTEQIDPITAGLDFAVDLQGHDFPGREALARIAQQSGRPQRVGLEMTGRRVPREGYAILQADRPVGSVSSGTFSPTFQRPLAMGYVEPKLAAVGTELLIDIRGKHEPAKVVELPFYKRPG